MERSLKALFSKTTEPEKSENKQRIPYIVSKSLSVEAPIGRTIFTCVFIGKIFQVFLPRITYPEKLIFICQYSERSNLLKL
jgi:hypothetical protein